MDPDRKYRLGSRSSPLALAQTHEVKKLLMERHPELTEDRFEIVPLSNTIGDMD